MQVSRKCKSARGRLEAREREDLEARTARIRRAEKSEESFLATSADILIVRSANKPQTISFLFTILRNLSRVTLSA